MKQPFSEINTGKYYLMLERGGLNYDEYVLHSLLTRIFAARELEERAPAKMCYRHRRRWRECEKNGAKRILPSKAADTQHRYLYMQRVHTEGEFHSKRGAIAAGNEVDFAKFGVKKGDLARRPLCQMFDVKCACMK